jgi:hypothetical protein
VGYTTDRELVAYFVRTRTLPRRSVIQLIRLYHPPQECQSKSPAIHPFLRVTASRLFELQRPGLARIQIAQPAGRHKDGAFAEIRRAIADALQVVRHP